MGLSDISGRGVFSSVPIQRGTVIAEMIDPRFISAAGFKKLCEQHGMKEDCGFVCKDGIVLHENAFCEKVQFRVDASWYCFNHAPVGSNDMNVRIERAVRNNSTTIIFVADCNIACNEELLYAYNEDR